MNNRYARRFSRCLKLEKLERRDLLAATLDLTSNVALAPQVDTDGLATNVNVSGEPTNYQSEMTLDVNPVNPLNLAGFSFRAGDTSVLEVFYSLDGGQNWDTTDIDVGFDPALAFDADGNLFIAYGQYVASTNTTTLYVAKSTNGGVSFGLPTTADSEVGVVAVENGS
jgi:hypothetical protein